MGIVNSNVFVENSKLSYFDIERFKELMIGDKVIIGCDEVIEGVKSEEDLLECLVYLWQQNSSDFRNKLSKEIKEWFITKFVPSNRSYYKGMHFKPGTKLSESNLDKIEFTSVTDDYDVAVDFAYGHKNSFKDSGYVCAVYEVYGTDVFKEVDSCRDMEEREFILMSPRFELLEVLN